MCKVHIFVSYAREDSRWFEKGSLMPRLVDSLEQQDSAEVWYDKRQLGGGDPWREEIEQAIDRSRIAVLLVSQDFLNSRFIREVELPRIEHRAKGRELVAIPILMDYCDWDVVEFLSRPQMIPGEPTPLVEYRESEARWSKVQHEIHKAIQRQIRKLTFPQVLESGVSGSAPAAGASPIIPGSASRGAVTPASGAATNELICHGPPPDRLTERHISPEVTIVGIQAGKQANPVVSQTPRPDPPSLPPTDLLTGIQRAVDAVDVERESTGYMQSRLVAKNSLTVWRGLYRDYQSDLRGLVDEMCFFLDEAEEKYQEFRKWKTMSLLKCVFRTPGFEPPAEQMLDHVCKNAFENGSLLALALSIIGAAPVPNRDKSRRLLRMLKSAPIEKAYLVVDRITPQDCLEDCKLAGETLLAVITKAVRSPDTPRPKSEYAWFSKLMGRGINLLRQMDYRRAMPVLRNCLGSGALYVDATVAELLSDWKDQESRTGIRQVIDFWRDGQCDTSWFPQLLDSLVGLEGAACADYLADIFAWADPKIQTAMVMKLFPKITHASIKEAVKRTAESTTDAELKNAAEAFLQG